MKQNGSGNRLSPANLFCDARLITRSPLRRGGNGLFIVLLNFLGHFLLQCKSAWGPDADRRG
jgi:hypothetical protein